MVAGELAKTLLTLDVQIPVIVREDAKAVIRGGVGELSLRKGARLELPLCDALPLIQKGVLELDNEKLFSYQDLNKIRWMETRDPRFPQALTSDFYIKAKISIQIFEKIIGDSKKIDNIKSLLVDIVKLRLQKILRAVQISHEFSREFSEKLTLEERVLYVALCKMVGDWYSSMLEFLEKGDLIG